MISSSFDILFDIFDLAEKLCYTLCDFKLEERFALEATCLTAEYYLLPDGQSITLNSERFMAPEALFRCDFVDLENGGCLDTSLQHAIHKVMRLEEEEANGEIKGGF